MASPMRMPDAAMSPKIVSWVAARSGARSARAATRIRQISRWLNR